VRRGLATLTVALASLVLSGPAAGALRLVGVASGLDSPVHATAVPGQPGRIYVVEQRGRIEVVEGGRVRAAPFLDITNLVSCCGERGLLSLAFHPNYPRNGFLYVNYTNTAGDTRVVRYRANASRTRAVESTARRILAVAQPYSNHNGGQIAFGRDGFLYVAMGDGGSGGDPENRAQNMRTRLGKLLRVNVATRRTAIVALGLRNPWRFSVDRATGRFYIGDVGQGSREEVDTFRPGARGLENYGWRRFEGTALYNASTPLYEPSRYVRPVHQYLTHANGGCAITGGFVYRGSRVRSVRGRYFFGDYCNGRVWSFRLQNGRKTDFRAHSALTVPGNLSSFGETAAGELLFVSHNGGRIFRLGST
jgi:glucose/arabinose dehydrogenase